MRWTLLGQRMVGVVTNLTLYILNLRMCKRILCVVSLIKKGANIKIWCLSLQYAKPGPVFVKVNKTIV